MTNKIRIITEWCWEELFLKEVLPIGKIKSAWSGTHIFLPNTSSVNISRVQKYIELAIIDCFTHILFIADLEEMDRITLESSIQDTIDSFSKTHPWIIVNFFIEVRKLEAWLLSDLDALKLVLGNHKHIPYLNIVNPTDSITNPEMIIKRLFSASWRTYRKNFSEKSIWKQFKPDRSMNTSFKHFYTTIISY